MSTHAAITLPTRGGSLELREHTGSSRCVGCGLRGGGLARLVVRRDAGDDTPAAMDLCGNCLAEGLAIVMGRRHVQRGGALEDLEVPPPA